MTILTVLLTAAGAFLIGSFPTAYLLVRRATGKDLRREGSGNIGTLNAFEVTHSRSVGLTVLILDLMKGALPVLGASAMFPHTTIFAAAAIGVVAGHNYSPWIGFKGGRGLAPAAGALLMVNPFMVLYWLVLWALAFAIRRNVHVGNIAASLLAPVVFAITPELTTFGSRLEHAQMPAEVLAAEAVCILILIRHFKPLLELLGRRDTK